MSEKAITEEVKTTVKEEEIKKEETTPKAESVKKTEATKKTGLRENSETPNKAKSLPGTAGTKKKIDSEKTTEIEKVKGDIVPFPKDVIQSYEAICSHIHTELDKAETSYLVIARELYVIRHKKLFQIENYASVYEMAQEKYGFSRGACNNYINICEKFGQIDEKTGECTGLLPEYESYSSSQLTEMLQVPKEHLSEFTPDMSVRKMRRLKKTYKENGIPLEDSKNANSTKTKKKELLKSKDITEVLKTDNPLLAKKLSEFESEHPDIDFDIAITIVYEE